MNNRPKISVIIPIYNVEKYIRKCLETIQEQTFRDFEVLMINDGTRDNSGKIAKEFAENDSRFTLYTKENGGLSDARNYGLARAVGDYVVFIDSDDCVTKDYLNVLYHECVDNDADMAVCRFYFTYFCKKFCIPSIASSPGAGLLSGKETLDMLIRDDKLQSYAWNKMYKRSLFTDHHIEYPIMYFEDIATTPRLTLHADKVAVTRKYMYLYEKRVGSIMATMNAEKINDYIRSYYITRNYVQKNGQYDRYKSSLQYVAKKMRLVNVYSIFRMHLTSRNFQHLKQNLHTNNELYRQLVSDDFDASDTFPLLPVSIIQAEKKRKTS